MSAPEQSAPAVRGWSLLLIAVFVFAGSRADYHHWLEPLVAAAWMVLLFVVLPASGATWVPAKLLRVLSVYVPFVLVWLCALVGYLRLMEALGSPVAPQPMLEFAKSGPAADGFWVLAISIVVLAPVSEEILFRGYLFSALQSALPMWAVQLLTATLFGLAHGLSYAIPTGILSLLFGYLRQRYHSLLPSILAHAVHNGVMLLLVVQWPFLLDLLYNR